MLIEIISDLVCPWCFVGKRRLVRALAQRPELRATLRWRTFQLNPEMPIEGAPRAAYLAAKLGGTAHVERIHSALEEAGRQEGIDFAFDRIKRTPNSLEAHRLSRWAAGEGRQDEAVEALFRAYFEAGRDIGKHGVLADIAGEIGLDRRVAAEWLASGAEREILRHEDRDARHLGVTGVPCFIIAGKYAISGAQEPEFFLPLFDLAAQEATETVG
jgi:predicted DsbA family dithiol-disulfide isomerase